MSNNGLIDAAERWYAFRAAATTQNVQWLAAFAANLPGNGEKPPYTTQQIDMACDAARKAVPL